MITVIKHGNKTFKAVCPICGCEFTYQDEDLNEDIFHNHNVICPDCGRHIPHDEQKNRALNKDILWDYAEEQSDKMDIPVVTLETKNTSQSK